MIALACDAAGAPPFEPGEYACVRPCSRWMSYLQSRGAGVLVLIAGSCLSCSSSSTPPRVRVLSFDAVPPIAHPNEPFKLVALVNSDYGRISARLGGIVKDSASRVYATLEDPGESAAFSAEVPWSVVDETAPLSFVGALTTERTFVSEFNESDVDEPFESDPLSVTFECKSTDDSHRYGLCGDRCTDFDTNDHCGDCATSCAVGQACKGGKCAPAT
jgi:hypothetical protein